MGTLWGRVAFATVLAVRVAEGQAVLDAAQAALIIRPPRGSLTPSRHLDRIRITPTGYHSSSP
jgi:hypothetical protein